MWEKLLQASRGALSVVKTKIYAIKGLGDQKKDHQEEIVLTDEEKNLQYNVRISPNEKATRYLGIMMNPEGNYDVEFQRILKETREFCDVFRKANSPPARPDWHST